MGVVPLETAGLGRGRAALLAGRPVRLSCVGTRLGRPLQIGGSRSTPRPHRRLRTVAHAGHGHGHGQDDHTGTAASSREDHSDVSAPSGSGACCGHSHGDEAHSHDSTCSHGHGHDHSSHSHDHDHSHEDGEHCSGHGCGHDHGQRDPSNPAHRALGSLYAALRLAGLAEWLEGSVPATLAKIGLFFVAAAASWAAGRAGAAAAAGQLASAALAGVCFCAGLPALVQLTYDVTAANIDTHVLMTLAALGTLVTGHALEGALLLVLFQTSHVVEHLLTEKAQGNLSALYDSVPKTATLVDLTSDGSPDMASLRRVRAGEVAVGALLLVKPGEQVPLDGDVVHGRALVSSEHITGESLPVLRRPGDEVPAGALNRDGVLVVRASRPSEESTPARIAALALGARAERPRLRTWLDEFGAVYSKAVVAGTAAALVALLAAGVPLLGSGAERGAFYRAMGLLTVASPCALVMVPLAYVTATAAVASRGVLLKGARVFDALAACRAVAFDKTGTLTTGALVCTSMRRLRAQGSGKGAEEEEEEEEEEEGERREALGAAVALSLRSSHPVSDAVVLHGERSGLGTAGVGISDFLLVAGGGVQGLASSSSSSSSSSGRDGATGGAASRQALFGSVDFVEQHLTPGERDAVAALTAGRTATSVTSLLVLQPVGATPEASPSGDGAPAPGRSVWVWTFEDSVREQSAAAIDALQTGSWTGRPSPRAALSVTMLTGDNAASAARIARKLHIEQVRASLSPEDKLAAVRELRAGSGAVAMVGDGLNDAAALAAADVGVAIASTATAAAALAADVIVLNGSGVAALPLLLRVARDARAVVALNLVLAFGSIAALALPTVLGFVPLWVAVMLHEGSTLLVALNSLRLLRHSAAAVAFGGKAGGGEQGQAEAGGQPEKPPPPPAAAPLAAAA